MTPNVEIGLVLISGNNFSPPWPTILDIKKDSPASQCQLKIGDQIKDIFGIPTESLTYQQFLALFSKATDEINMTVRRGVEPTERAFDWFKHPFSSVSRHYEEITISTDHLSKNEEQKFSGINNYGQMRFSSFKKLDSQSTESIEKCLLKEKKYSTSVQDFRKKSQSFSVSCSTNSLPRLRNRRRTDLDIPLSYMDLIMPNPVVSPCEGKLIVDEIGKLVLDEKHGISPACSSSTLSSFSSGSTSVSRDVSVCTFSSRVLFSTM